MQNLAEKGEADVWLPLEGASTGQLRIITEWFEVSGEMEDYEARQEETRGRQLATALLLLYIDSCHQLPGARTGGSTKPDPAVQVTVSSRQEVQETLAVKWSQSPVFEEGFLCLVNNPEVDQLDLKVYDEKSKAELGVLRLSLADLLAREGREFLREAVTVEKIKKYKNDKRY